MESLKFDNILHAGFLAAVLFLGLGISSLAHAETRANAAPAPAAVMEEIVVTAQAPAIQEIVVTAPAIQEIVVTAEAPGKKV